MHLRKHLKYLEICQYWMGHLVTCLYTRNMHMYMYCKVPSKRPYPSKRPPPIFSVSVVWVALRVTAHHVICGIA